MLPVAVCAALPSLLGCWGRGFVCPRKSAEETEDPVLVHRRVLLFALCQVVAAGLSAADRGLVSSVAVSPAFFNPTLKQQVSVRFALAAPARVGVSVLDRDRVAVRRFPVEAMRAGEAVVRWDGRDDAGGVVPNEA